jgi:hypothetical protein
VAKRTFIWIVFAALCVSALSFYSTGLHRLGLPFQLDYGEGMCWWQSSYISDYTLAYKPMDRYPYMVVHYPPLYHIAAREFGTVLRDWMTAARLLSLLSAAGAGIAIGTLIFVSLPRRSPLSYRMAAALFGACIVYPVDSMQFASFARVDMMSVFLTFAALGVFVVFWDNIPAQVIAITLSVAAFFTKQTGYTALLAMLFVLLLCRPRRAVALGAFAVTLIAIFVGYLSRVTHGGFLLNTVSYNVNPFSIRQMVIQIQAHYVKNLLFLACAMGESAALCAHLLRQGIAAVPRRVRAALEKSRSHRVLVILTAHLLLASAQVMSVGKQGAYINYFLLFDLTCGALSGFLLFRLLLAWKKGSAAAPVPATAAALILCGVLLPLPLQVSGAARSAAQTALEQQHRDAYAGALKLVRETSGLVYSEDMKLLMDAGKEMPAEPAIVTALSDTGRWNEGPFRQMFIDRRIALVVVYEDLSNPQRFTSGVRDAIETNYQPTRISEDFTVYRPKDRHDSQ